MSEYFQRTLRLKPLIENDEDLCQRIRASFKTVYGDVSEESYSYPDHLLELGRGTKHIVIGLRRTIVDPLNDREVYLAVKFNHQCLPYFLGYSERIKTEIGYYDSAFRQGLNPPYFVGIVTVETFVPSLGSKERVAGILMEDISRGKELPLIELPGAEFCERIASDGRRERFFIDPDNYSSTNGDLYLSPEGRIDL